MQIKDAKSARRFVKSWRSRWLKGNGLSYLTNALDNLYVIRVHHRHSNCDYVDLCEAIGVLKLAHFRMTGRAHPAPSWYRQSSEME